MGWRVLLSDDAEQDIEELYRFIAGRDGIATAERILGELETATASLEEMPERGNVPKELIPVGSTDYRELHHKPWRMIYRIMGSDVVVYCVVDGRRDMQSFLERRLLR